MSRPSASAAALLSAPEQRSAWIALRDRVASRARVRFDDGSGERELDLPGLREVAVSHESRPVRIEAYEAMSCAYGGLAEVVAACWDSPIADRLVDDRLRGRRHPAAATLEEQDLPPAVFTSLLEAVADSHGALQGFLQRRASSLGVEKLHATERVGESSAARSACPLDSILRASSASGSPACSGTRCTSPTSSVPRRRSR